MHKFIFPLLAVVLSGCTQLKLLPYLDQALLLKSFGQEKEAQHKFVINTDAKFDALVKSIESGDIKKYKTEAEILESFGPPIFSKDIRENGVLVKESLYRYCIQKTGPRRVYLYYDAQGQITHFLSI